MASSIKGVETKDEGDGGRSFALPLLPGSATGTWRVEAFADPKAAAIGRASFLVEDYIPERLDFSLIPSAMAVGNGGAAEISAEARFLYGAPRAGLEITGEVEVSASSESPAGHIKIFVLEARHIAFERANNGSQCAAPACGKDHLASRCLGGALSSAR
jgi:uncharacterized protein YfaS (alpha-2-macroglobulin family)